MSGAGESSRSTGPMSRSTETSESAVPTTSQPSMFSPADFPASPSVEPGSEWERMTIDGSGLSFTASFANYDRDTCSWRTCQGSLIEAWGPYLETWPRAGTTRSGKAFLLRPLVPRISATGFGYLPTPDASLGRFNATGTMDITSSYRKEIDGGVRPSGAKIGSSLRWCPELIRERLRTGGELNPEWIEVLMGYPIRWTEITPSATPSSRRSSSGSDGG